jgi:ribosomal protein L14E/L6E/L27E
LPYIRVYICEDCHIAYIRVYAYNTTHRGATNPKYTRQEGKGMEEGMSNAQLDSLLETIAKRLEEKEEMTPEKAAEIVRESKTKQ